MSFTVRLPDGTLVNVPDEGEVAAPKAEPRSLGSSLARQAGLSARMAANAVTGLPALVANLPAGAYNSAANLIQSEGRGFRFPDQGAAFNQALTKAGLPSPETPAEEFTQSVGSAVLGTGALGKLGNAAGGMAKQVFSTGLPTQMAAAGGGAAAAETTKQQGGGEVAQAIASLLGATTVAGGKALLQGAAAPVKKVAEYLTQPGRDQIKGRMLTDLSGNRRYELIDALENSASRIPGNKNTTALAAAELNMPELAAAEKYLGGHYAGNSFAQLAENNVQGRARALEGISGTPDSRKALVEAIKNQGEVAYKKAFDADKQRLGNLNSEAQNAGTFGGATGLTPPKRVPQELVGLQQNPVIQAAMREAEVLAKTKGISLGESPMESLTGLHYMKLALDNQFKNRTASTALQNYSDDALNSTKQALLRAIEGSENSPGVSPLYGVARQQYAESSKPLNQMKVAEYLAQRLAQPLDEGVERAGLFAQARRDAPGTLRKTLGGRQESLETVMSPEQLGTIDDISQELTRLAMVQKQASQGMPSAVRQLGEVAETPNIPTLLSAPVSIAKSVMQAAKGKATDKMLSDLAEAMQNPQRAAELLRNMKPKERIGFLQAAKRMGVDVSTNSAIGAAIGNMPYEENR